MIEHEPSEIISEWITCLTAEHRRGIDSPDRADAVSRLLDEAATDADQCVLPADVADSLLAALTAAHGRLQAELERAYRRDDVYARAMTRSRPGNADDTVGSFGWKLVPVDPDLAAIVLHDSAPRSTCHGVATTYAWVHAALAADGHFVTAFEPDLGPDALDAAARLWNPYDSVMANFTDVCDLVAAIEPV